MMEGSSHSRLDAFVRLPAEKSLITWERSSDSLSGGLSVQFHCVSLHSDLSAMLNLYIGSDEIISDSRGNGGRGLGEGGQSRLAGSREVEVG